MRTLATTHVPHPRTGAVLEVRAVEYAPEQLGLVALDEGGAVVFELSDDDIGEIDPNAPPFELPEDVEPFLAYAATEAWLLGMLNYVTGRRARGRKPPGATRRFAVERGQPLWKLVEASGRVVGVFPGETPEDALFVADQQGVDYDEDGLEAYLVG